MEDWILNIEDDRWKIGDVRWKMENWKMEDGRWKIGRWKMEDGRLMGWIEDGRG